jgi:hypothetical protein
LKGKKIKKKKKKNLELEGIMNKYILVAMIIMLSLASNSVCSETMQYDLIKIYAPENIFIYNSTAIIITLIDESTGEPLLHLEENVTCFIKRPDGGMLVNGEKPIEIQNGIYKLDFTVTGLIGTYAVWAIFDYLDNENYASGIFEARWNPYTNLTEAQYKIGDAVRIINLESRNSTTQAITHSSDTTQDLEELGIISKFAGIWQGLSDAAVGQLFKWLFMIVLMLGVFVVSNWYLGKRDSTRMAKKVGNLPQTIVETIGR